MPAFHQPPVPIEGDATPPRTWRPSGPDFSALPPLCPDARHGGGTGSGSVERETERQIHTFARTHMKRPRVAEKEGEELARFILSPLSSAGCLILHRATQKAGPKGCPVSTRQLRLFLSPGEKKKIVWGFAKRTDRASTLRHPEGEEGNLARRNTPRVRRFCLAALGGPGP